MSMFGRFQSWGSRRGPWMAARALLLLATGFAATRGTSAETKSDAMVDTGLLERLKTEGMASWRRMEQFAGDLEVSCRDHTEETFVGGDGRPAKRTLEWTWTVSWDPKNARRLIEQTTVSVGVTSRRVLNSRYRFMVYREKGQSRWVLESGRQAEKEPETEFSTFEPFEGEYECQLQASFRVFGVPLWELLEGEEFRLTEVRAGGGVRPDSGKLVLLRAAYDGPTKGGWRRPGGQYWAELDPQQMWLIVRGGAKFPAEKEENTQELTYRMTGAGIPFQERLECDSRDASMDYRRHTTLTFEMPRPCQRSDEEFFLEHYGIPETALATGEDGSILGRIALLALASSGVGGVYLLLWYVERRRRPGRRVATRAGAPPSGP